ncbi:MAG: restriction endonuclease [Promethearchaeota archaeon]
MPRRKTWKDELWDFLEKISMLYVFALFFIWFSDKELFFILLGWGLAILGALIAIIIFTQRFTKRSKIYKQSHFDTDRKLQKWLGDLKHWEFEHYIGDLFNKLGYKTRVIGGSYDEGIDVIAEKNGIKHYIQCKHYNNKVGVKDVREFYGALSDKLSNDKAFFITTNFFTEEAERFAENKLIELIDSYKLIKYIRLSENSDQKVKN